MSRPSPERFLEAAVRHFTRGERLDIQGLADELGVSRATAYRWAGGNLDSLTSKVVARLVEATWERVLREVRGKKGWERVLAIEERGMRYIAGFEPYREFMARDGHRALRIVASKDGLAHPTQVRLHQQLLEAEARAGHLRLPVDAHTLAYAMVRLAESFLYSDLIAGEEPDVDRAMQVMRLLCQ